MACLSKSDIANKQDARKWETVDVPEWGGSVNVRVMTANERDMLEVRFKDQRIGSRAYLACMLCCDENGVDLFSDEDLPMLEKKSASSLNRIFEVALRLNGMTDEAVAEMEKNSETT
ncbi:MAG: hypothetical protein IT366_21560 [Candidatus Hydrogenedentes bacterium]|nr:hypothetical protein [Candidatus Hydrogenedentota bacterium]